MRIPAAIALFAAMGLLCVTAGCGGAEDQPLLPEQVTDFQKLFDQNCVGCHGVDGKQGAGPQLNDPLYQALVSKEQLQNAISKGRPGTPMPAFAKSAGGTLTDRQIEVLASEMQKRWSKPEQFTGVAIPPYAVDAVGDVQHGAAVFRTKCLACHGVEGRGGPIAGAVTDPSYLALASDQLLRTTVIIGRPSHGMPDFRRSGKPIPAPDITDVVAWLVSHRAQPSGLSANAPAAAAPAPAATTAASAKGGTTP
ncbi:MAG TPA: cytochrome c [Bryobacteraceae bacterium]|nr:cytochrome c [Bryobacteraceae bacterium]